VSGNVDERIVEMTFKGSSFVAEIRASVEALLSLKNGLNSMRGSEKDINALDDAGKRFSLSGMAQGIDNVTHHFSLMRIAGLTAFTSLVRQGLFAGERLLSAFTIDPIKAGLDVYETKINAIQTILANTSAAGTTLKQVTAALNQLNDYANKTVYNFGQMAKNIGTFTAAGVGLKTAVSSIKGIANLAALSGSSAEQASGAMYQLSQAIASGKVKLQDWNSVVNAGIGGKVFQNALIETARVHGVAIDAMIKKDQGFRNTLQEGWLTSGILTQTLKTFTGDLSLAQIKALGYTNKEAEAIFKQGQIAVKSATQIRTISQLMQALKEEVATAWAGIFEAIIGNSVTATKTLSSFHQVAENALTNPIKSLTKVLNTFDQLGGRELVIQTITEAFHDLGLILHTVGEAFHEVFPPNGGSAALSLIHIAIALQNFVQALTPSTKTLGEFKDIFAGVFSAVKIVIDVIKAFIGGLLQIGSASTAASGGFLAILATIGRFITRIKEAIESGTALTTFFRTLGSIISIPIKILGAIIDKLTGFGGAATKATSGISKFVQKVGEIFGKLGQAITAGLQNGDLSSVASILDKLLLGGVLLSIRKFFNNLGKSGGGGKGLFSTIKESFESLTKTLEVMQANLKSSILEHIAIAVALLAASLLVLSLINVGNLTKALSAITVMFVQLLSAMAVITKVGSGAGIVKIVAVGVALNLLASALVILAGAVAILAQFSWNQLEKGIGAIGALLIELAIATALMSKNSPGLILTSVALNLIAVAIAALAGSVVLLGRQNLGTLAKGIGSIGVLLALLAGFNAISGVQLIGTAAAMVLIGGALLIITQVVAQLGALSIGTLAKGLTAMAAALIIIAGAMAIMGAGLVGAGSFVIFAAGLVIMAQALQTLGNQSWSAIGKSLVLLAGALAILTAAMILMTEGLPGAAAMLVMAAALAVLTPVLVVLGQQSWESIAKGLATLAGVFVILGAAGILLTPLVPTLLGLGLAIALFGAGLALAGTGVFLFATGLGALGVALTVSGAAILSFITSVVGIIPAVFKQLGLGIVALATALGTGAVAIENAMVAILSAILDGIIKIAPKAGAAFGAVVVAMIGAINKHTAEITTTFAQMVTTILNKLADKAPQFVSAGTRLMVNLLNGIAANVQKVANAGTNAIVAFINAIGNNIQRVVTAGVNMVINLVNGIANKIRNSGPAIHSAASNLGSAIIEGLIAGITGGIGGVVSAAENMAKSALHSALNALHINSPSKDFIKVGEGTGEGFELGIFNMIPRVTSASEKMSTAAIASISDTLAGASNAITDNLDLQPKITPVLDLTQVQAGAGALDKLTKDQLIAATSTSAATSISAANALAAAQAGLTSGSSTNISFTQNNTSPAALSTADIYRKTNNQLSQVKGALARANSG
jgi:tape measure domain-containing protein